MKHAGTIEIETERLLLRRFQKGDAKAAYHNWTSDPLVTTYLRWPTHANLEVTKQVLADWIASYERPDVYQWAIVLKSKQELIGTIAVVGIQEALSSVHIGYCIGSLWWKQGITKEAFAAIIPFLFHTVGVNRIESQHDPRNPNSGKVMTSCGLQYEGTLRQADSSNQGIVDAAMYSLLASEYDAA